MWKERARDVRRSIWIKSWNRFQAFNSNRSRKSIARAHNDTRYDYLEKSIIYCTNRTTFPKPKSKAMHNFTKIILRSLIFGRLLKLAKEFLSRLRRSKHEKENKLRFFVYLLNDDEWLRAGPAIITSDTWSLLRHENRFSFQWSPRPKVELCVNKWPW